MMVYKVRANINGSGELPLKLPSGVVLGVCFDFISATDTDLIGLRADKTFIPLTPVALLKRVNGSDWKNSVIKTFFNTKTYLRLVFNLSSSVSVDIFFFIAKEPPKEKAIHKFDVRKLNAAEFAGDTLRINVKGKINAIDLISFSRNIDWSVSDGYQKFLTKRTLTTDYTEKKDFFLNLLFPVVIDSNFIDITVENLQSNENFFLVYYYD